MRHPGVTVLAVLAVSASSFGALSTTSSARDASAVTASPAQSDATAAVGSAKAAVSADAVEGLLSARQLEFSFSSSPGTCPPGTSDASYCVGGTGRLVFTIVLTGHDRHHLQAATAHATITAGATVQVDATINRAGIALLRRAEKHGYSVSAALSTEAILSKTAYYTAQGRIRIK
jgi:hypothetical protein